MTLSLNILLDQLREYPLENHIPLPSDAAFTCCALLPRFYSAMRTDYLHVCRLSEALHAAANRDGMFYLCIRDRLKDDEETEDALRGMVILNENMDVEKLLNTVQLLFNRIRDWYQEMQNSLIREKPLQHILDTSEGVIGNTINISDSAFTLLARTRNIETDDPVSLALAELGYHPESTLKLFRQYHRMEAWAGAASFLINSKPETGPYPLVNKVFRFQNTYFTHVVMVCDHHPLSDGLLELFTMLTDILAIYAERNWKGKNALSHNYDQFMTDLLSGSPLSPSDIRERAHYLGIQDSGRFRLVKIAAGKDMEASLGRIGRDLLELIPSCQVILFQQSVVALLHFHGTEEGPLLSPEQTEHLLARHQARGGVSNEFTSLSGMAAAYEQASIALAFNGRLRGTDLLHGLLPVPEPTRICTFQDRVIHGILGAVPRNEHIWKSSKFYAALQILQEYDRQHNTNNLQLLRTYLYMERKATEVGQAMHMHRNNVIYHITRMEELTRLNLDDHGNRLGLELAFLMLELYGLE
ncbi:MAG: helix-turn-helix domain-containing protein [Oscillospiraceae bacterium]|nr:helix-turn-helix domain-containing protein [Oscillospiraceae bacterium]